MSREPYEIHIRAHLNPDMYPKEGRAWNLLGDRIRELIDQARSDPAFAAIHCNLDPMLLIDRMDEARLYDQ